VKTDTVIELKSFLFPWCRIVSAKDETLSFAVHKHSLAEIHYILKGEMTFYCKKGIVVQAGEFIFIHAGCRHTIRNSDPETVQLVMSISMDNLHNKARKVFSSTSLPVAYACNRVMKSLLNAIEEKAEEAKTEDEAMPYIVNSLVYETVDMLFDQMEPVNEQEHGASMDQRIILMQEYIKTHILDGIRGGEAAEKAGISLRQANRLCIREFGCTLNQLIVDERIQRIKTLLKTTDYILSDLAEITGFSSTYAFIRHFKQYTGETPGAYRKRCSQN